MRKFWSTLALLTLTASLVACGGSDNAFQTPGGSGPTGAAGVAKLTVASSAATLPPDGTTATITVTATDSDNVAVPGATVTFATSAGSLAVTSASTSATGQATATLSAQGLAANTVITITATSGSASGKTTVTVTATTQTLTLSTSVPQITSATGSPPATVKALVVDANNNVVPGVTVDFQATSGALTVTQAVTDATGTAIATLGAGTNQQNRSITVTATAGASNATIQVTVVGTTLTVSGPTSLVQGATGTYAVSLTDSGGNGIAGQTVAMTSASGNTLTPASVVTGANGTASTVLTATNAGTDTITATWQTMVGSQTVAVSGQNFAITAPAANALVQVAAAAPVTLTWTLAGSGGQSGTVYVTTSRGTVSPTFVTFTAGVASSPITVTSATAGPATISATAVQNQATVATAQASIDFVATTPHTVSVQASPSAVPIQGQSTLIATVIDPAGNPVLGTTVDFSIQADTTGGSLSAPSAVTNAEGQASVSYNASDKSSAINGVVILATVQGTAITNTTTLTVGGQTIFLSFGTGNTISAYSLNPQTQYELPYSVTAVDSAGHGLSGVTITYSVQSVAYAMGFYTYVSPAWAQTFTANNCTPTQVEEYNGVINPQPPPTGVTPVLTSIPGSVAATDVSSAVTSSSGTASVNLIYPKDHAFWVQVALTATATVQGTQNSATATFWLPGLAADYASQTVMPPGQISPYGENHSCY
jgi:Bacterial Ig-like domain (group 1)